VLAALSRRAVDCSRVRVVVVVVAKKEIAVRDVLFVALVAGVFAVLALIVRGVERL
jgi:hypothetical protein